MQNATEKEFGTVSMGCAAFLVALGFKMIRMSPTTKPRQRKFIFADRPPSYQVEAFYKTGMQLVMAYENNEVHPAVLELYQPSEIIVAMSWIKTKLYSDFENGE